MAGAVPAASQPATQPSYPLLAAVWQQPASTLLQLACTDYYPLARSAFIARRLCELSSS
jgi:hypothetical protein